MSITITSQPVTDSLNAAYRSIQLDVSLDVDMPIVFCDIYFNNVYYKTLSNTIPGLVRRFDILDSCQEVLVKYLAPNGLPTITGAPPVIISCYCKFRGSSTNANGTIDIEATEPIQGTDGTPPVSGTGEQSNTFSVLYSTLQHEDNQDLATHLATFKNGTWAVDAWPLSHRLNGYKVQGSDYFPIVYKGSQVLTCIKVTYKKRDGTTAIVNTCGAYPDCPLITGITIQETDLGDGTQKFSINWNAADPLLTVIQIKYRTQGSVGAYTLINVPLNVYPLGYTFILPLGLYQFKFKTLGFCIGQETTTHDNEGIEPPVCDPVTYHDPPDLPDAIAMDPYVYNIPLMGTPPFAVSNITKPAWVISISINPSGTSVDIFGKPLKTDVGVNYQIKFDITNACGSQTVDQLVDVLWKTRTILINTLMGLGTYSQVVAQLSGPVDADFNMTEMHSGGYLPADCSGEIEVATVNAFNKVMLAGQVSAGGSDTTTGDWTPVQSFRLSNIRINIPGGYSGQIFAGDFLFIGTYKVFVTFGGCAPLSIRLLAENSDTLVTEAGDPMIQH